ncbi:MNN4 [Candida pseudojiufengensis]|uniref:MNN4 n=1 Tax=Candida pseudojiufengensis TaxID=497109 RepID=UPI002223FF8B|nr:MNN4 [Candida pseudojiufengensis]KAI5965893.1 MNN4 [Candida pseudojiufengensis]
MIYKIYDNKNSQTSLQSTATTSSSDTDRLDYHNSLDPESDFNYKVNELLQLKIDKDIEDKYWILNTKLQDQTNLQIPSYYYSQDESKPILQPFDPRFTLSMYYYYINKQLTLNKKIETSKATLSSFEENQNSLSLKIPFNWYDWIEMSILDKFILAPDSIKPNCSILSAELDHKIVQEQKLNITTLEKEWNEAKKKEEEDKKNAEEAKKKEEEEQKKKEEEEKKQKEEEEKKQKKEEERKQKEEEERRQKEEEAKNQQFQPQSETKNEPQDNQKQQEETGSEDNNPEENKDQNNENSNQVEQPPKLKRQLSKREEEFIKLLKDVKPVEEWCIPNSKLPDNHNDGHNNHHPGFNVFKMPGRTANEKGKIIGKSYMYSFAPPPSSIIFLTDSGSYTVDIDSNSGLLNNEIPENYVLDTSSKEIDILKEFNKLLKNHKPNTNQVMNEYSYTVPASDFHVDCNSIINDYEKKISKGYSLTRKEQNYYNSLKYSIYKVENGGPTKYFDEARLLGTSHGDHYDWRFFNGIRLGSTEQLLTLHRLVRAWSSFTRKNGINTWIAHGSLLSWYWNGIAFPWDNDIDVQMPIMDLHKLSLNFNQTLIVEDPKDGFGRYFVDCGTFLSLREKGNGLNNIDARFIDIDTGMYIDITALSISNTKPPDYYLETLPTDFKKDDKNWIPTNEKLQIYNCRNNHFTPLEDISPLIKTIVEGEFAYIPKRLSNILSTEYKHGLSSDNFEKHVFIPKLRLWIKEEDLYYFLKDRQKWINYHTSTSNLKDSYELTKEEISQLNKDKNPYTNHYLFKLTKQQLDKISNFDYNDVLDLLLKDDIMINYLLTRDFTAFHEQEIMKLTWGKTTNSLIQKQIDFNPLKFEPFLYNLKMEFETFENKVYNLKELESYYKSDIEFNPFEVKETTYDL